MNFGEHTLLVVLVAFAAGIALGRFWPGGKTLRRSRPQQEPTSIHYILGIDLLAAGEIDRVRDNDYEAFSLTRASDGGDGRQRGPDDPG